MYLVFFTLRVPSLALAQLPQDPQPTQTAIDTARVFAPSGNVSYNGVTDDVRRKLWSFSDPAVTICIDTEDNQIGKIHFDMPVPAPTKLTLDQARILATSWLTQHNIPLSGWSLDRQTAEIGSPEANDGLCYDFTWGKRSPDGVGLPGYMFMTMRNDGAIWTFTRYDRTAQVSLTPSISLDQAFSAAVQEAGWTANAVLEEADLFVGLNPDNSGQFLTWYMVISDTTCTKMPSNIEPHLACVYLRRPVTVNALTGEVGLGSYGGSSKPPAMNIERGRLMNLKDVALLFPGSKTVVQKNEATLIMKRGKYTFRPSSTEVKANGNPITLNRKVIVVKGQYLVSASILDILNKPKTSRGKQTVEKDTK
jgi:hypothetical protein